MDVKALAKTFADDPDILCAKGILIDLDGAPRLLQAIASRWSVGAHDGTHSQTDVCIGPAGFYDGQVA